MVGSGRISPSALREVIQCLPDLIAIDLSNTEAVDDSVLNVLGRTCGRLQGLNVSGCKGVGDDGVRAIAKGCKMIRRVRLPL
jgi:F-box and leucine-rich repeat protein GRR1